MTDVIRNRVAQPQPARQNTLPTIADYVAAYGEFGAEVVNGEIIPMHPPKRRHVLIAHRLLFSLKHVAETQQLGEVWTEAPFVLDADDRTDWVRGARVPDVAFVTHARIEAHEEQYADDEGPWRLAPDLAVEIVSPKDSYTDVNSKVAEYLRYGVRLVWVIDPKARTIRIHTADDPDGRTLDEHEVLTGDPVLPGWSMAVAAILDGNGREKP